MSQDPFREVVDLGGLRDVAHRPYDLGAAGPKPLGHVLGACSLHVAEQDTHVPRSHRVGQREPDATPRPRDHRDPPCEVLHAAPSVIDAHTNACRPILAMTPPSRLPTRAARTVDGEGSAP